MAWSPTEIILIAVLALIGGAFGGLLGLGGSLFIIPALTFCFGANQHLYQAAALIANIFVAAAATLRHRGKGTLRKDAIPTLATAAGLAALFGVAVSNMIPGRPLMALFGAFLLYCAVTEVIAVIKKTPDIDAAPPGPVSKRACAGIGFAGGFGAGLLGIGGGAIMVPLMRSILRLPIRQAVANSAAAIIAAALVGATAKNASLSQITGHSGSPMALEDSLALAVVLSPPALVGGHIGATLVYRLPINAIRVALSALLAFGGIRMMMSGLGL